MYRDPRRRGPLLPGLQDIRLSGVNLADFAAGSGETVRNAALVLSRARRLGAGVAHVLTFPAALGRPVEAVSYVKLRHQAAAAAADFEGYCQVDCVIDSASMLAGPCDYVLWSRHADLRGLATWHTGLALRPEVAQADSKAVTVRFGHTLGGIPVFEGNIRPARARRRRGR